MRNHAEGIVACDFFVSVTATFQLLYVSVVMEHASRRILHTNVTRHPTAAWTIQQLREAIGFEKYRYLLYDRNCIFSQQLDGSIRRLGFTVLKSPPHSPKANALCERLIGTIRRECLDWLIPMSEAQPSQGLTVLDRPLQRRQATFGTGSGRTGPTSDGPHCEYQAHD